MNPLEELESEAIPVNWSTVELGLEGPGSASPQIGLTEVQSWLVGALTRGDGPERAVDVIVAIDNEQDTRPIIAGLATHVATPARDELRKWQAVMLRRQLDDLPEDPFYAALALADFWSQFDDDPVLPSPTREELGAPLTMSDRGELLRRHSAWLEATLESLRTGD